MYIYIYIYTAVLPLSCTDGRYFLSYFGYSTIFRYKLRLFRGNSDIFITFGYSKSKSRK